MKQIRTAAAAIIMRGIPLKAQSQRNVYRGVTLVELMVVISIFGLMIALLLPAVQAVREAARQSQCLSNLRQLGVALTNYESARARFPAGRDGRDGWQHSWATRILPHLEQNSLFEQYDFQQTWDSLAAEDATMVFVTAAGNWPVASRDLSTFLCPSTHNQWQGATDYGGIYGSTLTGLPPGFWIGNAWDAGILVPINLRGIQPARRKGLRANQVIDGLSKTVIVAEDAGRWPLDGGNWANGHQCFGHDQPGINLERSNEIYSDHPGGANVVMADASASLLSTNVDAEVLGSLCVRDDGS